MDFAKYIKPTCFVFKLPTYVSQFVLPCNQNSLRKLLQIMCTFFNHVLHNFTINKHKIKVVFQKKNIIYLQYLNKIIITFLSFINQYQINVMVIRSMHLLMPFLSCKDGYGKLTRRVFGVKPCPYLIFIYNR
jgi:hypothetical protein